MCIRDRDNWFRQDGNYVESEGYQPMTINNAVLDDAGKPIVSLPELHFRNSAHAAASKNRELNTFLATTNGYKLFVTNGKTEDPSDPVIPARQVGWMGDIYISNDLVIDVLKNTTKPVKELLDSVLDEMEKAVDGFWSFQVTETISNGISHLTIIEANLANDSPTIPPLLIDLYGSYSHVLSSNFTMDIPKAMASKVVMQKSAATGPVTNSTDAGIRGLFSSQKDLVLWDYKSNKHKPEPASSTTTAGDSQSKPSEEEIKKERWKAFTKSARMCLQPKESTDSGQNGDKVKISTLSDLTFSNSTKFIDGADNLFLPGVCLYSENFNKSRRTAIDNGATSSSSPLPIKVDFTIMGISGFKVGDILTIKGVPAQYTDQKKGVFMVIEIKHKVDNKLWTTSVTAMYKPRANS